MGLGFLLFEALFLSLVVVILSIIIAIIAMTWGVLPVILFIFLIFIIIAYFNKRVYERYFTLGTTSNSSSPNMMKGFDFSKNTSVSPLLVETSI